jgi:hypothetical protein
VLVVFGGYVRSEDEVTTIFVDTLETFNGTGWNVEKLQFAIYQYAMVQLPCP